VSERACGADERRGVERGRRVVGAGPPAHVVDDRLVGRVERLREDLRDVAVPDALGLVALVVQVEVARLEGVAAGLGQVPVQLPVRFGIERFDLSLAVDDQLERRSLHPAHGDEVLAELAGGQREEAGERRAPRQVDHLPGLPGGGQIEVELVGVRERLVYLVVGDRGEPDAVDGSVLVHLAHQLVRLADQLALAVVVGRDDDSGGVARQFPEGRDDSLLGGLFGDRCVDQFDGFHVAPIVVLGGEVDADDVTREADTALAAPLVHVHVVFPLRRCGLAAQDVGDATRRVVFLRDYQFGAATHCPEIGRSPV